MEDGNERKIEKEEKETRKGTAGERRRWRKKLHKWKMEKTGKVQKQRRKKKDNWRSKKKTGRKMNK